MLNLFGKTIRLFLVDGTVNGLTTVELSNWTGIGIKVPRIKVKDYINRAEFQRPGVYILIGKGDRNEDAAYVGEAEVIRERLLHHITNKEFWNEVIFFGSKDKYLNKASVKYLESRLYELAKLIGRYQLVQTVPTKPELSEAEQAELEEFLANVKLLTATLGHKIFESLEETIETNNKKEEFFYCRNNAGANGKGSPSTEGFIVFKGASLIVNGQQSLTESICNERAKMLIDGVITKSGDLYILNRDYVFNSPSRAAAAILARSASGPLEWKTNNGILLKEFEVEFS